MLNAGKEDPRACASRPCSAKRRRVLDLFCELLVVRLPLIESTKDCRGPQRGGRHSVSPRVAADAIPELKEVRAQFAGKYGSQYVAACGEDATAARARAAMRKLARAALRGARLALAPPRRRTRRAPDLPKMAETTRERDGGATREAKMAETTRGGGGDIARPTAGGARVSPATAPRSRTRGRRRPRARARAAAADAASRLASRDGAGD